MRPIPLKLLRNGQITAVPDKRTPSKNGNYQYLPLRLQSSVCPNAKVDSDVRLTSLSS